MTPTSFSSWSDYFNFTLAREFVEKDTFKPIAIEENWAEKIGHTISRPVLSPINFLMREIKNPLVLLALTVGLVALATLIFYPAQFMLVVYTVLPFLASIEAWMVKGAAFVVVQAIIAAIALRALGRLNNKKLLEAWHNNEIVPIHIGSRGAQQQPISK